MRSRFIAFLLVASLCLVFLLPVQADTDGVHYKICGHSLAPENSLRICYYVDSTASSVSDKGVDYWLNVCPEDPKSITPTGTMKYIGQKTIEGILYDDFYLEDIKPQQMTDTIYACPYTLSNGKKYYGKMDKYSVLQYCIEMYDSSHEGLREVLDTLLAYGAACQKMNHYREDSLADGSYSLLYLYGNVHPDGFRNAVVSCGSTFQMSPLFTYSFPSAVHNVAFDLNGTNAVLSVGTANASCRLILCPIQISLSSTLETYTTTDSHNEICLKKYQASYSQVILPDKVMVGDTVSFLSKIGESAFAENTDVVTVRLPESMRVIDKYAFEKCSSLQSINLVSAMENINTYAFNKCTSLSDVQLYSASITIASDALKNSGSVMTVTYHGSSSDLSDTYRQKFPSGATFQYS